MSARERPATPGAGTTVSGSGASPKSTEADPAAERAGHMLSLVLERSPRTLTELAEAVGLSAVAAAPLLAALERHGLLAWDGARSGLRPGPAELRASPARASAVRISSSSPRRA